MNFDLSVITTNAVIVVPIIIALVQAIKLTGIVKDHFSPLVAIVIGVLIGWLGSYDDVHFKEILLSGAVYGLIASGLYSGVKTTMLARNRQKIQQNKNHSQKRD